jgi:hypothetical protein
MRIALVVPGVSGVLGLVAWIASRGEAARAAARRARTWGDAAPGHRGHCRPAYEAAGRGPQTPRGRTLTGSPRNPAVQAGFKAHVRSRGKCMPDAPQRGHPTRAKRSTNTPKRSVRLSLEVTPARRCAIRVRPDGECHGRPRAASRPRWPDAAQTKQQRRGTEFVPTTWVNQRCGGRVLGETQHRAIEGIAALHTKLPGAARRRRADEP